MRLIDIDDISLRKTIACGGLSAKALWRRIQQQPTIDAVSEWIPCEERLPNRQGYYICTCKDGSKYKRTTTVKWSNGWQLTGARAYWVVIAWMPLPKPYGEREGE